MVIIKCCHCNGTGYCPYFDLDLRSKLRKIPPYGCEGCRFLRSYIRPGIGDLCWECIADGRCPKCFGTGEMILDFE